MKTYRVESGPIESPLKPKDSALSLALPPPSALPRAALRSDCQEHEGAGRARAQARARLGDAERREEQLKAILSSSLEFEWLHFVENLQPTEHERMSE
ncbi:hypothetical protein MHYP_G00236810 [Metynnis hypsauchen]